MLSRNLAAKNNEDNAPPAARFPAKHGNVVGARAPSMVERSRAMGLEAYMASLQLDECEAYDAQGIHLITKLWSCESGGRWWHGCGVECYRSIASRRRSWSLKHT